MLVHKEERYIEGFPRFILKVNYSSRTSKFSIPLPDFMSSVLEKKELEADTQAKVEQLFKDASEEVKKAKTTVEKVIVYRIESDRDGAVSVRAAVANQMTVSVVGGRSTVSYEYLPSTLQDKLSDSYARVIGKTVPYSEENEALFRGLTDDVNNIIKKLGALGTWTEPSRYSAQRSFTLNATTSPGTEQ